MNRCGLLLGALASCATAVADTGSPGTQLLQKELFVRRLLEARQPGARADAGAALLHARAVEHLRRGEYREAQARLDESIRAMQRRHSGAGAATPDAAFERLRASVQLMRATYAGHLAAGADPHGTLLAEVDLALREAEALRGQQRMGEGARALELAEQSLTHALTQLLGTVTVSYAPRLSDAEEEYRHEARRNQGYAALVPAAIRELRPHGTALMLVQRYVESSEASAARAEGQAAQRDWAAALESMRGATRFLQLGLGAAGLALPQGPAE